MDRPQVGNQSLRIFYSTHRDKFIFKVFGLILDYSLIQNYLLGNRSDRDKLEGIRNKIKVHHLQTVPAHANKWRGSNWDCSEKYRYQQYFFRGNK